MNKKKFSFFLLLSIIILNPAYGIDENNKTYFLSLKKDVVFVRQGPSLEYPIKMIYKKKYLPVEVIDSWENFKKVKDYKNNVGWIHIYLLSKKKTAINIKNNSIIFKSPTIYSKPIAKLEKGRLIFIKKCQNTWCKVTSANYKGWIKKEFLWGKT